MNVPDRIARAAEQRVAGEAQQIESAVELAARGVPLAAEYETSRLAARLQRKTLLPQTQAEMVARGLTAYRPSARGAAKTNGKTPKAAAAAAAKASEAAKVPEPERIWGASIDFVDASFLERGFLAARAVARIAYPDGSPRGTGFLISDRLLVTNNHVIDTQDLALELIAEFDYELGINRSPLEVTRFRLAPGLCFVTDDRDDLDYTVIALGERVSGRRQLAAYGFCALSSARDKHALGEVANIVQHPDGRYKEVVLRENRLVSRLDTVLHYVADTEPGSSGSPVFNNDWQVIALHHWGGPWRQRSDDGRAVPLEVNEGIRTSAIVAELRDRVGGLVARERQLIEAAIGVGESTRGMVPIPREPDERDPLRGPRVSADGVATWSLPLELSVRLPMAVPATAATTAATAMDTTLRPQTNGARAAGEAKPSTEYSDRSGYKPGFLAGQAVPLPRLSTAQRKQAAENQQAEPGDDPYELKYHHFSVVMNKTRRLAFFTACNIDGKRAKKVDRSSGTVGPLDPDDVGLREAFDGAEASESWYYDERLERTDHAGKDIYEKQRVPGFPTPSDPQRILRMFQRGHIVRRMDPAWGSDALALKADADTFHWTNCAPQVGFFNMGKARRNTPGSGGGKLWRAIENYVLRNARAELQRVSVFAGPIFRKNDRAFRGIQVPGEFWKVAVWTEDGELRSIAMIADQRPVITAWPEAIEEQPEAFTDEDELAKVEDFVTTVADIEDKTGLDFGAAVRAADIHAGGERAKVESFAEALAAPRGGRKSRKPSKAAGNRNGRQPRARA